MSNTQAFAENAAPAQADNKIDALKLLDAAITTRNKDLYNTLAYGSFSPQPASPLKKSISDYYLTRDLMGRDAFAEQYTQLTAKIWDSFGFDEAFKFMQHASNKSPKLTDLTSSMYLTLLYPRMAPDMTDKQMISLAKNIAKTFQSALPLSVKHKNYDRILLNAEGNERNLSIARQELALEKPEEKDFLTLTSHFAKWVELVRERLGPGHAVQFVIDTYRPIARDFSEENLKPSKNLVMQGLYLSLPTLESIMADREETSSKRAILNFMNESYSESFDKYLPALRFLSHAVETLPRTREYDDLLGEVTVKMMESVQWNYRSDRDEKSKAENRIIATYLPRITPDAGLEAIPGLVSVLAIECNVMHHSRQGPVSRAFGAKIDDLSSRLPPEDIFMALHQRGVYSDMYNEKHIESFRRLCDSGEPEDVLRIVNEALKESRDNRGPLELRKMIVDYIDLHQDKLTPHQTISLTRNMYDSILSDNDHSYEGQWQTGAVKKITAIYKKAVESNFSAIIERAAEGPQGPVQPPAATLTP